MCVVFSEIVQGFIFIRSAIFSLLVAESITTSLFSPDRRNLELARTYYSLLV